MKDTCKQVFKLHDKSFVLTIPIMMVWWGTVVGCSGGVQWWGSVSEVKAECGLPCWSSVLWIKTLSCET